MVAISSHSSMGKTLSIALFCVVMIFLLFKENEAGPEVAASEANYLPMFGVTQGSLRPQDCSPRCTARCSATAYKKPCMFFCQKCCAKCLCVPAGTYGNKQFCPCYNNWKTKRGGPKCP